MNVPLLFSVSLLLATFTHPARAGGLDDAGRATRERPSGGHEDAEESEHDSSSDSDCDDACAEAVAQILFLPWSAPRAVLASDRRVERWYDDYPYARRAGYLDLRYEAPPGFAGDESEANPAPAGDQVWAAQARVEGGANLEGVGRAGVLARLLMPVPIELEVSWLGLAERDGPALDWAQLSGLRLNWRFAEARSVQFRTGIGYQHWVEDAETSGAEPLTDEQRSQPGAELGYGFDAFVGKPFVLSAEGRVGVLGQAFSWQARATLGAMWGPLEWYAGYDELNVGGVSLGGPIAGLRGFL